MSADYIKKKMLSISPNNLADWFQGPHFQSDKQQNIFSVETSSISVSAVINFSIPFTEGGQTEKRKKNYCWYYWPVSSRCVNISITRRRSKHLVLALQLTAGAPWLQYDLTSIDSARPHCHRNCSISHALLILQVNDCEPFAGTFIKCCISYWVHTTEEEV